MTASKTRFIGFDFLRTISFVAIVIFHATYLLYGSLGYTNVPVYDPVTYVFVIFARALSFSGFSIVLMTFFLMGYRGVSGATETKPLVPLLIAFYVIWQMVSGSLQDFWDIYPFLLFAIGLTRLSRPLHPAVAVTFGAAVTTVPFWHWENVWNLSPLLEGPLLGGCRFGSRLGEDWPLLPWLAYPLFGYGLGRWAVQQKNKLSQISKTELAVWSVALALLSPGAGTYFWTPIGNEFACFMFRQSPQVFWFHQGLLLFAMRLSMVAAINLNLCRSSLLSFLGRRQINRHFFLAYFVHYLALLGWSSLTQSGSTPPSAITFIGAVIFSLVCAETVPMLIYRKTEGR